MSNRSKLQKQKLEEDRARLCSRIKLPGGFKVKRVFYTSPSGVSRMMTLAEAQTEGLVFVFEQFDPATSPLKVAFLRPTGISVEVIA